MASTIAAIAAKLALLFTPPVTEAIFVIGLAAFVVAMALLFTALFSFFTIAYLAGRKTGYKQKYTIGYGSNKVTFDELALIPLLMALGIVIVQAFSQFFSALGSAGRSIVEFIINNPRRIISLILLIGFIAVLMISPQLIYPITTQAWNCFVGGITRIIILPASSFAAFITSNALPLQNFISRFSKTATTSAILHAIVGAAEAVVVSLGFAGVAIIEFAVAQTAWVGQVTPPGQVAQMLVQGPDFGETAGNLGAAVFTLQTITEQACAPLSEHVFEPIFAPFIEDEFIDAVNATLAFPYVLIGQGILRPIGQYLVNLGANPGGDFSDFVSTPSFNSSIDTLNTAQRNWFRFFDSFFPNLVDAANDLLRDVTGLPLPDVPFPRRGVFTLFLSGPIDLILRVAKLTQNLVFTMLFDPGLAFSYPDGVQIWKWDEVFDGVREYVSVLTDLPEFFADYLRALGLEFQATLPDPEDDIVNDAMIYVANIIDKIPCLIDTLVEAVLSVLSFLVDLIVGTVYVFLNAAFSGNSPNSFRHAQVLFGDEDFTAVQCRIQSTIIFTAPVLIGCADRSTMTRACVEPVLNQLMVGQLAIPVPGTWAVAPSGTLTTVANICDNIICSVAITFNNGTFLPAPNVAGNQFRTVLRNFAAPIVCLFDILTSFCPPGVCPFDSTDAQTIVNNLVEITLLPITLVVHANQVTTTSFLFEPQCFPVQSLPSYIEAIFDALFDVARDILNAILPMGQQCFDPAVNVIQPSPLCCVLDLAFSPIGLVADIARLIIGQVQTLLVNLLPALSGGAGLDGYTPANITIPETWIKIATQSAICVVTSPIDNSIQCTDGMFGMRATITLRLSNILVEGILIIPRFIVNLVNGLFVVILDPSLGSIDVFLRGLIQPFIVTIGNIFLEFGAMVECIDDGNAFSTGLTLIGLFLVTTISDLVGFIIDLSFGLVQLAIGFFAVMTGDVTIIANAFISLLDAFIAISIVVLSQSFVCTVQDVVCAVPFVPDTGPIVDACNAGIGAGGNDFGFTACANRKRSDDHQAALDCFEFIATYGYKRSEHARADSTSAEERQAAECFAEATQPGVLLERFALQTTAQNRLIRAIYDLPTAIPAHWVMLGEQIGRQSEALARQQRDFARTTSFDSEKHEAELDLGAFFRAFNQKYRGKNSAQADHFVGKIKHRHTRKRSTYGMPSHANFLVNLGAAMRHVELAKEFRMSWHEPNPTHHAPPARPHEHASDHPFVKVAAGMKIVGHQLHAGRQQLLGKLANLVRSITDQNASPRPPKQESRAIVGARKLDAGQVEFKFIAAPSRHYANLSDWAASGDRVAPLAVIIDEDVLPVLGLPECDEMEQTVCTGCAYVDDLLLVSERSFLAAKTFYTTPGVARGSIGYIADQMTSSLERVLLDPAGTDTYSTEPRTVLHITDRLWEIRWAWDWDYSELLDTVLGIPVACDTTDPLAALDIDQGFKDAFNDLFGDLTPIMQQLICRATVAPAESAMRVTERYLLCDYDEALYSVGNKGSASIDGPQQLLDGFANSLLLLAIFGLLVEQLPGGSSIFMMVGPFVLWFGTFWIGYGSSPGCTLPGPMQLFGAYPVAAPMDAYGLLESTLTTPPFPFGLIDTAFQDQYAEVLITECGVPPPIVDCSVFGFDSIYDNIFFTTGVLFGDEFNQGAASTIGAFSDLIQQTALEWTEERIAELDANHNIGDVCNRLTFGRALIGLLGLAGHLIAGFVTTFFVILFLVPIVLVIIYVFLLLGQVLEQIDEYYIDDDRIRSSPPS